jgi:hypothetical protein
VAKYRHAEQERAQRALVVKLGLDLFDAHTAAPVVGVGSEFDVAISQLNGTRYLLRVHVDDNVARLKHLLHAETEINADQQHLYKGGDEEELRDAQTLGAGGISEQTPLFLVSNEKSDLDMVVELEKSCSGNLELLQRQSGALARDRVKTVLNQNKAFVIRWRDLSLQGSLPDYFQGFQMLSVLDLSNNLLTGPIPNSFACMLSLRRLTLSDNKLEGSIPDSLGACG